MARHTNGLLDDVVGRLSLDEVETWYRVGNVSQQRFEEFKHAWVTGSVRFNDYPGWGGPCSDLCRCPEDE